MSFFCTTNFFLKVKMEDFQDRAEIYIVPYCINSKVWQISHMLQMLTHHSILHLPRRKEPLDSEQYLYYCILQCMYVGILQIQLQHVHFPKGTAINFENWTLSITFHCENEGFLFVAWVWCCEKWKQNNWQVMNHYDAMDEYLLIDNVFVRLITLKEDGPDSGWLLLFAGCFPSALLISCSW
jgi:hypothetical protein